MFIAIYAYVITRDLEIYIRTEETQFPHPPSILFQLANILFLRNIPDLGEDDRE